MQHIASANNHRTFAHPSIATFCLAFFIGLLVVLAFNISFPQYKYYYQNTEMDEVVYLKLHREADNQEGIQKRKQFNTEALFIGVFTTLSILWTNGYYKGKKLKELETFIN